MLPYAAWNQQAIARVLYIIKKKYRQYLVLKDNNFMLHMMGYPVMRKGLLFAKRSTLKYEKDFCIPKRTPFSEKGQSTLAKRSLSR